MKNNMNIKVKKYLIDGMVKDKNWMAYVLLYAIK